ncbi:unnamed protein product [Allacma fusca]|uniref:Uncharacterized protein n=1 Tax=Allacma fusca TaxID=39272 RepID=A0A8J2NZG9_9HEXA|nr:unnamed protein product [Allacma fusca]
MPKDSEDDVKPVQQRTSHEKILSRHYLVVDPDWEIHCNVKTTSTFWMKTTSYDLRIDFHYLVAWRTHVVFKHSKFSEHDLEKFGWCLCPIISSR